VLYRDRWIECTEDAVRVRFYYFPFGTKSTPYSRIRAVQRVTLSTGKVPWCECCVTPRGVRAGLVG
jgi:hypothetical protein